MRRLLEGVGQPRNPLRTDGGPRTPNLLVNSQLLGPSSCIGKKMIENQTAQVFFRALPLSYRRISPAGRIRTCDLVHIREVTRFLRTNHQ
jgi:hypothetical protein